MPDGVSRNKIKTPSELSSIVNDLQSQGKTVALCHGVFDLLHPGHIRHLQAAKRQADILLVTITRDEHVAKGPGRPAINHWLRCESIAAIEYVDYVALSDWPTAVETIKAIRPNLYVKGRDYSDPKNDLTGAIVDEERAVLSVGGRIVFTDDVVFSSSNLLNAHFPPYPEDSRRFLASFRNKYSSDDIIQRLKNLQTLRVLVLGDAIIDEYHYCDPLGKSPKENIITTRFISDEAFPGGVLAAANHLARFCGQVHLVTCLGGTKSHLEFIQARLSPNITTKFFYRPNGPTTVKRRFIDQAFMRKLFQVSFLELADLPSDIEREVCDYLVSVVKDYDLVLVTDFGHGFIGRRIIDVLCDKARFLAVNAQTNSENTGFNPITRYSRADYASIDEPELRFATRDRYGELRQLVVSLSEQLGCMKISVTLGHRGSVVYGKEDDYCVTPVFSTEVLDTVGAGDAYLAVTAPCVFAGFPSDLVGFIGNAVGALAIRIVGNRTPIEPVPLFKFITALLA